RWRASTMPRAGAPSAHRLAFLPRARPGSCADTVAADPVGRTGPATGAGRTSKETTLKQTLKCALAAFALAAMASGVSQAKDLKVGLVVPLSGPFASTGQQMMNGVNLYVQEHGATVAGRKVVLIVKDDTGVSPAITKRQAQELLIKDEVDVLAGFGLTPGAFATAPLAEQTEAPMVVMNAATSAITTRSDYITRTSTTLPQVAAPMATWAKDNGVQ